MRITSAALVFLMGLAAAGQEKKDELQGSWKLVEAELAGKKLPTESPVVVLEMKDGTYTVTGLESPDRGTVKVDPSKTPATMDITSTEGPTKGRHLPAIYERTGDTLRICYDLSNTKYPDAFHTAKDTKLYLATYKREK
jgi:uncharacterized protein (TIGR03067 family)